MNSKISMKIKVFLKSNHGSCKQNNINNIKNNDDKNLFKLSLIYITCNITNNDDKLILEYHLYIYILLAI